MIPFANRLPFGTVRAGRLCARPDIGLQGFVLHGFAHRQEWSVSAMSEDSIDMALVHSGDTHGWPWPWAAKQRITLGAYGLRVEFEVTNLANVAAPLALGWHPYFAVGADIRAEDLRFAADKCYHLKCYHLDGAGAPVNRYPLRGRHEARRALSTDGRFGRLRRTGTGRPWITRCRSLRRTLWFWV